MNEAAWNDERVSSSVARHIDALCQEFEAELRAGGTPNVELFVRQYAGDLAHDLRTSLLIPELTAIMAQYEEETSHNQAIPQELAVATTKAVQPGATAADHSDFSSGEDFPIPQQLREYQIQTMIGRGGMGAVYRALHTKLHQLRAIKVLQSKFMQDRSAVARFIRENRMAGQLDHPNVVRAVDAGEIDDIHFLVMEHVDGIDLARLSHRLGPLPVRETCDLIRQAAEGLQHAHEHGLVHRDVKPSNLMVTTQGVVKVLDFGLARLREDLQSPGQDLTASGQIMGTWEYVAPEQISNSHVVDIRADIYSLGCTLFKLLVGRSPFNDGLRNSYGVMCAHATEPVPEIRKIRSDISEELADILERMMSKAPEHRFAEPSEVAEALGPFSVASDLPALVESASAHAALSAGQVRRQLPAVDCGASTPQEGASETRRRWVVIVAAAMLVLLISIAVAFQGRKSDGGPVDLLAIVDLNRDAKVGNWRTRRGQLISPVVPKACIHIPYSLPDEYRLQIDVQREQGATLVISAVHGVRPWTVEFSSDATIVGNDAEKANGHQVRRLTDRNWDLTQEGPSRLTITVRRAKLQVTRDGQKAINWTGSFADLMSDRPDGVPDDPGLFIVTHQSEYWFSMITLDPLSDN